MEMNILSHSLTNLSLVLPLSLSSFAHLQLRIAFHSLRAIIVLVIPQTKVSKHMAYRFGKAPPFQCNLLPSYAKFPAEFPHRRKR